MRDYKLILLGLLVFGIWAWADDQNSPYWLRFKYGVENTFSDRISTPQGSVEATIVKIALAKGETAQLVIPPAGATDHRVYVRDKFGDHPLVLEGERVDRDTFVRSEPLLVERWIMVARGSQEEWQKEVLAMMGPLGTSTDGYEFAQLGTLPEKAAKLVYDLTSR